MSLLKHLAHVYSWYKYQYYFSLALSVFAALWSWLNPFGIVFLDGAIILISLLSCFTVFKADHASWKFIQSLPLSRRELYHFKILDTALSFLPLLVWSVLFHPLVWTILTDEKPSFLGFSKMILFSLVGIGLVSVLSFSTLYNSGRSPYNRGNQKSILYQRYRDAIYVFTFIIYSVAIFSVLTILLKDYLPSIALIKSFVKSIWNVWTLLVFCIGICYLNYKNVFHVWMDEKRSYIKLTWAPRKDIPRMAVCIGLIVGPIAFFSSLPPSEYGESKLTDAVYEGNLDEVKLVLKSGVDINKPSSTGFTALMVAAHQGNLKLYRFLLEKGASRNGKVTSGEKEFIGKDAFAVALIGGNTEIVKDLFRDEILKSSTPEQYPLHVAAHRCHVGVIDFLIEKGAQPNFISKKGKTALHYASAKGCLNGVISLIEAGADTAIKDKEGKIPAGYIASNDSDLGYYLNKKSRTPASTK